MIENRFDAMTVNERLYASRLLTDYDEAVKNRDSKLVREILLCLEIGEENVNEILERLGLTVNCLFFLNTSQMNEHNH